MRTLFRIAGLIVLGAILFVGIGPLLPEGNPIKDAADLFLEALKASWGISIGFGN